jgi:hypothetical protein
LRRCAIRASHLIQRDSIGQFDCGRQGQMSHRLVEKNFDVTLLPSAALSFSLLSIFCPLCDYQIELHRQRPIALTNGCSSHSQLDRRLATLRSSDTSSFCSRRAPSASNFCCGLPGPLTACWFRGNNNLTKRQVRCTRSMRGRRNSGKKNHSEASHGEATSHFKSGAICPGMDDT